MLISVGMATGAWLIFGVITFLRSIRPNISVGDVQGHIAAMAIGFTIAALSATLIIEAIQ